MEASTPPPPSGPPPGWYDDPNVPGQQRYWDGSNWTDHVHSQARPYTQPQAAQTPVTGHPVGVPAKPSRPWWQRPWALIVGGLLLLIIVSAIAGGSDPPPDENPTGSSSTETASRKPRTAKRVPNVKGERLDVAKEKLRDKGLRSKVIGGGTFGVVEESEWEVVRPIRRLGSAPRSASS